MAIAFFDLDRTLISANSGVLWLRSELRQGQISPLKAMIAALWVTRYHLGFAGKGEAVRRAIGSLAGSHEASLRERTLAFYDTYVRALYRPGARHVIGEHRARGDRVVLLSSTSGYLADAVGRDLQLDDVLCNRFEVDEQGFYTGRCVGELCYGVGKLRHAESYAERHGFELAACAFYTDSFADLPVMEAVGRPVAVNPDQRLRRVAVARGWQIVDWGTPRAEAAEAAPT